MDASGFAARRITRTYRQTINAAPESVFPLICPVREAEWLDGWRYAMIYSASGLVEEGAVFSTPQAGEADTVWIVTRHDPERREVKFTRFTPGSRICVLRIAVSANGEHRSFVDIAYTYTATAPAGNDFIDRLTQETFLSAVRVWEKSMNHFLETGERLIKA
jgi:ribosome modulation factor